MVLVPVCMDSMVYDGVKVGFISCPFVKVNERVKEVRTLILLEEV